VICIKDVSSFFDVEQGKNLVAAMMGAWRRRKLNLR